MFGSVRFHAMVLVAIVVAFLAGCSITGDSLGGNAAHGQNIAASRCAACHGADGNSATPAIPRLAGLNSVYMYRQLVDFKHGARPSSVMAPIAAALADEDLRDAATFFAAQARGSDAPGPYALIAQGRRLFLYGTSSGNVPACAACHSPGTGGMAAHMRGGMGMGHMSMMGGMFGRRAPSLYGQHADYVVGQLRAFADGTRPATIMAPIAGALTARQVQAVAHYVAAHP
ncbi:c-type cytochrome [Oleiagrimonas sp.]|jgi:cytochrome c553|uniref:c-type cytochrome n=1 Tax=Oleiagrimonas sp. TaxID=2010330 RepID=UPI00260BAE15|nr:c-type cytochrome [Oleiagrimonas sp.]MDA3913599.1 c-type cytochrome [Oleiagrimonas sp.]